MGVSGSSTVRLIGAPVALADGPAGVESGPAALRRAGIAVRLERLGYRVEDAGDIESPTPENTAGPGDTKSRYLAELVPVLEDLAAVVRQAREEGRIPLVLGGNHSVGLGALSGMTGAGDPGRGDGGRTASLGLIWVDAHPDANTPETTATGNLSGMPLAALFGRGRRAYTGVGGFVPGACRVRPENTVLIGVRSVDEGEDEVVADIGVRTCTMEEVDRRGMAAVVEDAVRWALDGNDGLHLSVDMDALDPAVAPGVSVPEPGGLTFREARLLMERVAESGGLRSMDIGEVNPRRDAGNRTAEAAAALVASAFGKRILPNR